MKTVRLCSRELDTCRCILALKLLLLCLVKQMAAYLLVSLYFDVDQVGEQVSQDPFTEIY